MAGFLPPISTTTGFGHRLLNVLKIELKPISNEPVKSSPSIPSFSCSSAPTVPPGPLTMLKTPRGRPARSATSASLTPHSGASLEGLYTTALPATRAPPAGPPESAIGKLKGLITAQTPWGLSTDRVWTVGSPRLPIGWSKPSLASNWSQ